MGEHGGAKTSARTLTTTILVTVLLVPASAAANVGTPLMWASTFHLVIANALIGLLEGWLLVRFFRARRPFPRLTMIAANYFSAWLAFIVLVFLGLGQRISPLVDALLGQEPLYRVHYYLAVVLAACLVTTVVLEWPFVAFAMRGQLQLVRRSLWASAVIQAASYVLLVGLYFLASSPGLLTSVSPDRRVVLNAGQRVHVYYVSLKGALHRVALDGSNDEKVADLPWRPTRLFPSPVKHSSCWDLYAENQASDPALVLPCFAGQVPQVGDAAELQGGAEAGPGRNSTGWDLRSHPPARGWHVRRGQSTPLRGYQRWETAYTGIEVVNSATGASYRVACAIPWLSWPAHSATVLPGDKVVFELDSDPPQIVLLDVPTRRVGLVALGTNPVATVDGAIPWRCDGCDALGSQPASAPSSQAIGP